MHFKFTSLLFFAVLLFGPHVGNRQTLAQDPIAWNPQVLPVELQVGYAVRTLDISGDGKLDIMIVDSKRILWLENPSWESHVIHSTPDEKGDNVSMAPLDVDGDGKIDLAIGQDWQPNNTESGGRISWLKSPADPRQPWSYTKIAEEPTTHRMHWADLDRNGRSELLVLPLKGKNTTAPGFDQHPVRLLQFQIPQNPIADPWPMQVLDDKTHVSHNFQIVDVDHDDLSDLLVASYEGVTWLEFDSHLHSTRTILGNGHPGIAPVKGSSEVRLGRRADGTPFIATIEPWHGDQVVVYNYEKEIASPWARTVIDHELKWGHAVACANLDEDADDELVIGVRDNGDAPHRCGVRVYDWQSNGWKRTLVEPGQVAVEDMVVADLNGDGRNDIIAVGRATHNAVIYWNQAAK